MLTPSDSTDSDRDHRAWHHRGRTQPDDGAHDLTPSAMSRAERCSPTLPHTTQVSQCATCSCLGEARRLPSFRGARSPIQRSPRRLDEAQAVERHGRRKQGPSTFGRRIGSGTDRRRHRRRDRDHHGRRPHRGARDRPHAGELIHELALAAQRELKLSNLAELMHIYPTYSTVTGQIAADHAIRTAHKVRALARAGRILG